jgi:hypothetical protein
MSTAYERWTGGDLKGKAYEGFLYGLTSEQRKAVVLGNFNYQVENGGFMQWVDNGYAVHFDELVTTIKEMRGDGSKEVEEILNMLSEIKPHIQTDPYKVRNRGFFGRGYWAFEQGGRTYDDDGNEDNHEDDWEEVREVSDRLSNQYYEINEEFMNQVEEFLSGNSVVREN